MHMTCTLRATKAVWSCTVHENYSSVLSSGRRQLRSSHFAEVLRFGTAHLFVHSLQTRAARKLDDCAGALNLGPPPVGQVCDRFWGCRAGRSANLPCITNSETCHKLSISLFVMQGRFAERPAIPKKGRDQSSPHTDSQRLGKCLVWEWLSPVPAP
jgi:hypothetical protein